MHDFAEHGMKHFCFDQEGCGVGPIPHRERESLVAIRLMVGFDASKWTGPGDAGRAWLDTVERAMERLSEAGIATRRTLGDGTVIYERNRARDAQPGAGSARNDER